MMGNVEMAFKSNLKKVMGEIDKKQKQKATAAAMMMRGKVVETLTGERSGREYTIPETGVKYRASAPGEPPAQRLGELRGSIAYKIERMAGGYDSIVGSDKKYAPKLEFGTSKILARPFLRPTFEKNKNEIRQIIEDRWF